ncbi:MAG TPA: GNAT family N-acetyltransferase [Lapillicoccus sp.]|nr:GNAT family N-acetyltransferase [Lapillicoccus sp.]
MTEPRPLRADGERVWVANATEADVEAYIRATLQSSPRLREWNPVDPYGLPSLLRAASGYHRTFLIHAVTSEGDHDLVGKVNVTNVVRGRALGATLGYDAFDPYAGRGLFAEGLRLVVDLALGPEPQGMGLHRLEANVQPANVRSAAVLRGIGFRREGFSPSYLLMPTLHGADEWRDHDRYALTRAEWPAEPWPPAAGPRIVVLVNGVPGSGKSTLARRLAAELGVPLFGKDIVKEALAPHLPADYVAAHGAGRSRLGAGATEALWALCAASPTGAVVESWFWPDDGRYIRDGLRRAGLDAARVPEVWCDVPLTLARERFEGRAGERHAVHGPQTGLDPMWAELAATARPQGIGPLLRVDTTRPLRDADVGRVALHVRAAFG